MGARARWGAVVLAGGRSARMGTDKAWLDAGGVPALRRVVDVARKRCAAVVVVGTTGQALPELSAAVVRIDDPPGHRHGGPLVGVAAGLAWLDDHDVDVCILTACDVVLLSERHVEFMLERLERAVTHEVVVPTDDSGRTQPFASAVRVVPTLARARSLLAAGDSRTTALTEGPRAERLPAASLPDPRVILPSNTPQQWDAIRDALRDRNSGH